MSADHSLATAKDRLTYLVRREIEPVAAEPVDTPEPQAAASLRPDVRDARLRVEQARLAFRLQAAERIPDIALVVSNTTPVDTDVLPRSMSCSWPLRGITSSVVRGWGIGSRRHAGRVTLVATRAGEAIARPCDEAPPAPASLATCAASRLCWR